MADLSMTGAKFSALPAPSADFVKLYSELRGAAPSRLDSFGFDAATLAIEMLHSGKSSAACLLDPSGYRGLDGLFRLRPDGASERALQILELSGDADARIARPAARDFLAPMYSVPPNSMHAARAIPLIADGINPMNYIKIPESLRGKYKSKTYGARAAAPAVAAPVPDEVVILPEDDSDVIESPDFQPVRLESVDRKIIDSVEVAQ
jgi:hypothetical protein